jgi:hypothetical protein
LAIKRGVTIKRVSELSGLFKQGLLYVGFMGLVVVNSCAISAGFLEEDGPVSGAFKERGAV